MMVCCPGLAVMNDVYRHIRVHGDVVAPLSRRSRRELPQVAALLPLFRANLSSRWAPQVHCSDASPTGLGVLCRDLAPSQVSVIGGASEKWRYRAVETIQARQCALGGLASNRASDIVRDAGPFLEHELKPFCEVGPDLLKPLDWSLVHAGKLLKPEHITRSEGRCLLYTSDAADE